ncbi:MAG: L,D-transpeptidase family protein [Syntrophomonadaceae bacterium]|jgi:L,D-transpeptidase ErfK/SrfK
MVYASRFLRLAKPELQGPDIMYLQELLRELGFYHEAVDGIFGLLTHQAVTSFQSYHNLPVDGVVDPSTWLTLYYLGNKLPQSIKPKQLNTTKIVVDLVSRKLTYYSDTYQKTFKVAIGKSSTPSPIGNWIITQKAINPGGPFGARWMRLSVPWGGYGIHGTNNPKSIGKAISHGCIRMYNQDVISIYNITPIGTPVAIIGRVYTGRLLSLGSSGSEVKDVQKKLKLLRYYKYKVDGYYGEKTKQAVVKFQQANKLSPDGIVGPQTYNALQKAVDIAYKNDQP